MQPQWANPLQISWDPILQNSNKIKIQRFWTAGKCWEEVQPLVSGPKKQDAVPIKAKSGKTRRLMLSDVTIFLASTRGTQRQGWVYYGLLLAYYSCSITHWYNAILAIPRYAKEYQHIKLSNSMPKYLETTYYNKPKRTNYRVSESQGSEAAKAANDGLLAGVSASVEMCSLSTKRCHELGKKPLQRNKV